MKILIYSARISAVLAGFSVLSLIFLFLALSDIANHEANLTLEWYVSGICLMFLTLFTISTIITLGLFFRMIWNFSDQRGNSDKSHINDNQK